MIANTSCTGYWYKGTFKQNCISTNDSNSIGIGFVQFFGVF